MPKSSRHKSHKHSKHGSKDAREYFESEEDTKMRDFDKDDSSARVSKTLGSSEKRKDPPTHSNGDVGEEYVSSKRRREREKEKEKEKANVSAVSDRWNGGGGSNVAVEREKKEDSSRVDIEKPSKSSKSIGVVDSKSKSSKAHDDVGEKKEESRSEKKEESRSEKKEESKRKYEKELVRKEAQQGKDMKEFKEKAKIVEREKERKVKDVEREVEDEVVDIGDAVIPLVVFGEEKEGRHGKEINVWPIEDERNLELEKDLEKRSRKRDGSNEKDKYKDDKRRSEDLRVSSRGERANDEKYKDEKYKDEKYKDGKYKDEKYKVEKYVDEKYKDEKYKDDKYREDDGRDTRYKDEKNADDIDRDRERRYRDAKYRESIEKVNRHKDEKYREDVDKDKRLRDDRYREGGERENKYREAKYRDDADKDYRRKFHEDGEREDRHRDDWYFEDNSRDGRNRDEKKQRDDSGKDKRVHDIKFQDERLVRDGTNDSYDLKRSRDESEATEFRQKRSNYRGEDKYDDRGTRYKDDRGKRRASEKEEYDDTRIRGFKEQHYEIENKSSGNVRVESVATRGRSGLREADIVNSPNHGRRGNSPSYRGFKQEESRYREYNHGGRERRDPRDMTPAKDYTGISGLTEKISRPNEQLIQRDDGQNDDTSTEKRLKEDTLKSPLNRADITSSLDIEDSVQRNSGSKEGKEYYRDNRGTRDLPNENLPRDDIPQPDTDNISVSSHFAKPNYFNNNRSSLPPTPYRGGPDRPFDDDNYNRNKQNRRRRMDPNMGRQQGNAWRGVPNWPNSPVANGFVPFQHGPPPLGFHPVMQQFPNNPIFNVRPSMEMNQTGFPGHIRPLGWDGNNSIYGDEAHLYGRPDWDNNRNFNGGRGWENSRDMWKGQNAGSTGDLISVHNKDDTSNHEDWPGKSATSAQKQTSIEVESVSVDHSSGAVESDSRKEASKAILGDISEPETKDDDYISRAYLSMLDISEDLSQCELYSQYTNLVGIDQSANAEKDDFKLVIMEDDIDALGKDYTKSSGASLFCTTDDSIFQRAMSLVKEVMTIGQDKVPSTTPEQTDYVSAPSNDEQPEVPAIEAKESEIAISQINKVKIEETFDLDGGERSGEPGAALDIVKMEIDPVIKEEIAEDGSSSPKELYHGNMGPDIKDGKFNVLPFSGTSAEVDIEVVNESGSVNLSRIQQSPESTH